MVPRRTRCAATIAALLLSAGATAQEGFDSSRTSAAVLVSGVYTDNFYYGTGSQPVESAFGSIVAPSAVFKATRGRLDLLASADAELGTFNQESADNYVDAGAAVNASWLATRRGRLDLRAGFERSHDPFGVNRTENAAVRDTDLDLWQVMQAGVLFHYGAPEATLNTEVGLSALDRSYQTNQAATRYLDYQNTAFQYTVFYNFSPKTAALLDFVRTNVQFDEPFAATDTRSGDEYRVRTGVRWLATGKTSGDLRFGIFRREFDDGGSDEQGFDWQATARWAPRARTLIELAAERGSQESYRSDTRVNLTQSVAVNWKQYWGARTSSRVSLGRVTTDFVGIARKDTAYNVRLGLDYLLSPSLSATTTLESFNRTSNEPTSEFDRITLFVGARLEY